MLVISRSLMEHVITNTTDKKKKKIEKNIWLNEPNSIYTYTRIISIDKGVISNYNA